MGEATETLVRYGWDSETLVADVRSSRGLTTERVRTKATPRRRDEHWCSSLSREDLACLLQVIEGQVIPQLLNGYSPAKASPLE